MAYELLRQPIKIENNFKVRKLTLRHCSRFHERSLIYTVIMISNCNTQINLQMTVPLVDISSAIPMQVRSQCIVQ